MNTTKILRAVATISTVLLLSVISTETAVAQDQLFEKNTDRIGRDYTNFDIDPPSPETIISSEATCQLACQRDNKCRAWTHVNPGLQGPKAKCWLKDALPSAKPNNCCTSGVIRREFETSTDRPGRDISNFNLQAAVPGVCEAACRNDQRCFAWTYVKPGVQAAQARCWLKNDVPPAQPSDCCVSGVVPRDPVVK